MLECRADAQRGRMPIHLAALRGETDVIALLCEHGSPLRDADADGTAPLHKALGQGHVEAAQLLLAYGADAKQPLQVCTKAHAAVASRVLFFAARPCIVCNKSDLCGLRP